jgi:hypothetical protein
LLYTETTALEWLFPQEKATLRDTGKGTWIGEPLYPSVSMSKIVLHLKERR